MDARTVPALGVRGRRWLDDPANTDANSLERISALLMVGNVSAGRALLDVYVPVTDVQVAAVARLRAHLRAPETGTIDMAPIVAASQGLGDADRRYQLTAAAWAQAWLDIEARRPWRSALRRRSARARAAPGPGRFSSSSARSSSRPRSPRSSRPGSSPPLAGVVNPRSGRDASSRISRRCAKPLGTVERRHPADTRRHGEEAPARGRAVRRGRSGARRAGCRRGGSRCGPAASGRSASRR